MRRPHFIGVDIDSGYISAAAVEMETKTIIHHTRKRKQINSRTLAAKIIHQWCEVIRTTLSDINPDRVRIGIAIPGLRDQKKGFAHIDGLDECGSIAEYDIKELLAGIIGISTDYVHMYDDAVCFLQGEVFAGSARRYPDSIGITLGNSIGCAIHKNGITRFMNEIHSPFEDSSIDDFLSSRWFVREYFSKTGKTISGVRDLIPLHDEPIVKEIFSTYADSLTRFLREMFIREKPSAFVLGGEMMMAAHLFLPAVQRRLHDFSITVPVCKGILGDDATILGTASLFFNSNRSQFDN